MHQVSLHDVKEQVRESPGRRFSVAVSDVSGALQPAPGSQPPFHLDRVVVPAGKKNWPLHAHATQWEMCHALEGSAMMRTETDEVRLEAGDVILCPPGDAHQIINDCEVDFVYLAVSSNQDFDICYYPDSDKLAFHNRLGAGRYSREGRGGWTRAGEGLATDYWSGEEDVNS